MVVYCREVYQLEDKFDGLKLNHIPRCLNDVADTLAKTVSSQEQVSAGVFASDQYKPLVCYEEPEQTDDGPPALGSGANQSATPSDPEVMELNKDPMIELDPLADWRAPYLDYHLREAPPMDKTEARWLARRPRSFAVINGELYRRSRTEVL